MSMKRDFGWTFNNARDAYRFLNWVIGAKELVEHLIKVRDKIEKN